MKQLLIELVVWMVLWILFTLLIGLLLTSDFSHGAFTAILTVLIYKAIYP